MDTHKKSREYLKKGKGGLLPASLLLALKFHQMESQN